MNILIDIAHPAHVHLLKLTYFELINKGHSVIVTVKDIPSAQKLMDVYGIPYINLGKKKDSLIYKAFSQLIYDYKIWRLSIKYGIDIGIGSSITIAHASKFCKMKSIVFDDDDDVVEPLFVKYAHPFADIVLSPSCLIGHRETSKAIFYDGYHELAYLHPKRFVPDENILKEVGLTKNDKFFILRFNAFKAHHDVGVLGLSIEDKRRLVKFLSTKGKVFITTERNIDEEFLPYQLKVSPEKAHSLMYYATMFVGDSQTMTSEAAVLGVPAIRCNTFVGKIAYLEEEEYRYGLTYGFLPEDSELMFKKIEDILSNPKVKEEWAIKRNDLLVDKIDVTAFFVWFIENYPESAKIMKENPNYQDRFR